MTFDDIVPASGRIQEPQLQEMDAASFARERLGFAPDARQTEVLRLTAKRVILNCSRQWGKSTVAAAKALHRVLTVPRSLVLVASPSAKQSAEFLRKAGEMLEVMGIAPRGDGDNEISLLLPNRSRIVGLPGNESTGRGFSNVSMLLIDEAAVVEDSLYKMLRPVLSVSDGDLWLMSTPRGKRGFFYATWAHGGPEWVRVSVPATECARIPKAHLEDERRQEGMPWFRQEYMCEFVDNEANTFNRDLVERAVDGGVSVLNLRRLSTWKDAGEK